MARTNSTLVQGVLLTNYAAGDDLAPFVATAASVVSKVAACATRKGQTQSDEDLELMERWLAAHAYKMSRRPLDSTRTLSSAGTFSGKTGMNLQATTFGQMALSLDHSGCLAAVASGARRTASMSWGGKPESEEITYDERNGR